MKLYKCDCIILSSVSAMADDEIDPITVWRKNLTTNGAANLYTNIREFVYLPPATQGH